MKGKINKNGSLLIERNGKYKDQWCLYDHKDGAINCGDWCPQFGEPEKAVFEENAAILNICQKKVLVFDDFEDERNR